MRRTAIATATLLVSAVIAVTVINANSRQPITSTSASSAIDVMQMMRDANNLPVQQFDAY